MPIVSVNPEADPPQPRAPVRPNRAEQDGETAEEKSQEHKGFIQEGNRAPVSKATHSRYREGPVDQEEEEGGRAHRSISLDMISQGFSFRA